MRRPKLVVMMNHDGGGNKGRWGVIAAMLVALCSLGVALWQGWETRENNRLSVVPHLQLFIDTKTIHGPATLELQNTGIGPAVIDTYKVFLGDSLIFDSITMYKHDKEKLKKLLRPFSTGKGVNVEFKFGTLMPSSAIPSGERFVVFSIGSSDTTTFFGTGSAFDQIFDQFNVIIGYNSMYGTHYHLDSKDKVIR